MQDPRHDSRVLLSVIAALSLLLLSSCVHSPSSGTIDVGGHRLSYRCAGEGTPIVVMDGGLGETMKTWEEVTPEVQAFTKVCVYDRAGMGGSEQGPMPRTSQRAVDDLHALLARAGLEGPYILVGHSLGGLNVRLFASEHPDEVAGLVLVDATHEDYPSRERELRTESQKGKIESAYRRGGPAVRSEYDSILTSAEEIRSAPGLSDIPVIVITAGRGYDTPELKQAWLELQRQLVLLVPRGLQIMADESSHNIQFDQPALIVEAVHGLVAEARAAPPSTLPPRAPAPGSR